MIRRWRVIAHDHEERTQREAKLEQIVEFIGRQASIATNPTYGDLQGFTSRKDSKPIARTSTKYVAPTEYRKSVFTSTVAQEQESPKTKEAETPRKTHATSSNSEPCVYCEEDQGSHTLASCKKFTSIVHNEKLKMRLKLKMKLKLKMRL